jgi:hypothetical protein
VFGNRVLKILFVPKRDVIREDRKKLRNEELHNLHSSLNIIRIIESRRVRWVVHVAPMGVECIFEKPEGKRLLRRFRRRWKNSVKMVLR